MPGINGNTGTLLLLLVTLATFCASEECEEWKRVKTFKTTLLLNGSVWDHESQILYPPGTYWKENYNDGIVIYGCPCKLDRPCLRKCCQRNEAMDFKSLQCITHDAPSPWFRPNVTINDEGDFRMENEDYFGLVYGKFCKGYLLEPEIYPDEDKFYVNFTDGTLSIPQHNKTGLGPADYCLEYIPAIDSYRPFVCFRTLGSPDLPRDMCNEIRFIIYPIGMLISTFFLLISLFVYILLPKLRNLHGKCLMCHIVSLLIAYVSLAIVQGLGSGLSDSACSAFGFLIYLSFLCCFFWLNIMCIDIFIAFSSFRPMEGNAGQRDRRKFLLYVSYAWGIPLIIILATAIIELHPDVPDNYIKPNFKRSCWFESDRSRLVYFIIPVGIIVFCNIILFLVTALNIFRLLKMADNGSKDRKEDKYRFKHYLKLSIVMGVSWAMEIISWLVGGSACIWIFPDLVNTLQGLFLFLIFVCKKKVLHQLKKRYFLKKGAESSPNIGEAGSPDMASICSSVSSVSSTGVSDNLKLKRMDVTIPPK